MTYFQVKKNGYISLKIAFVIPLLLQIICTVAVIAYSSHHNEQTVVKALAGEFLNQNTQRVAEGLRDYLAIPQFINHVNADLLRSGQLSFNNIPQLKQHLASQLQQFNQKSEQIRHIAMINRNGQTVIAEVNKQTVHTLYCSKQQKPCDQYWQTMPVSTNGGTPPIVHIDEHNMTTIQTVSYANKQKLLAILSIVSQLQPLHNLLADRANIKNARIFIIERDGKLVASSVSSSLVGLTKKSTVQVDDELIDVSGKQLIKYFNGIQPIQQHFRWHDMDYWLQVSPYTNNHGLQWFIVVVYPQTAFINTEWNDTPVWLIVFLMTLLNLGLALLIVYRITKPIKQLNQAIAASNWQDDVYTKTVDQQIIAEIHWLSQMISHLDISLKTTTHALEQQVADASIKLQQLDEQLQKTSQTKSDFISKINHNLRSSLNAVLGFSDLLLSANDIPNEHHEQLAMIYKSGRHVLELLNDFVAEARGYEVVTTTIPYKTVELTAQHFQVMPMEWLNQLFETLLEANKNQLVQLIQQIPRSETFLIQQLTELVNQFQFEYLFNLIEPLVMTPDKDYFSNND